MLKKQILTRGEFEQLRRENAREMSKDVELKRKALEVKIRAGHEYYWVHQMNWMGEPVLQLPQDLMALQEIIFRTKPDFIIETGVAWGGSLLFYATLLEALGHGSVVGIDTFIPEDLKARIKSHGRISDRISLIQGSSTDPATLENISVMAGKSSKTMVILDSDHTHDHVLAELKLFSPLVRPGFYLICGDTIVEDQPPAPKRPRPWGKGNNPKTALVEFLKSNDRFEVDSELEDKLLLSNMPGGYLRCIKE